MVSECNKASQTKECVVADHAKRILIIDSAKFVGGAELYVFNLAQKIDAGTFKFVFAVSNRDLIAQNEESFVFLPSEKIKTLNILMIVRNILSTVKELIRIVRCYKIDVIQTNTARMHIIGTIVAVKTGKPLIWVNHSYDFPKMMYALLSFIPVKIVHVSRTIYNDYALWFVKKSKLEIIFNGVDMKEYCIEPYKMPGFDSGRNNIGIIGRIEEAKGQEYLIRSMPDILHACPNTMLYIIGQPGPGSEHYRASLNRIVAEYKLERNVKFTGYIKDMAKTLNCLDVIVQASIKPESFGRVIIEAMALGKPVVATNIGGFRELIKDGDEGILVAPEDAKVLAGAIIELLNDKEKAYHFGRAGKKKVMQYYTIERAKTRFCEIYAEITK
jgi:glycosyltransferase involved in cell wall biosynthesis